MGNYTDTLFCCGTDYKQGHPEFGKYFEDINELKSKKTCWVNCGIIQVVVTYKGDELFHSWIENGEFNDL